MAVTRKSAAPPPSPALRCRGAPSRRVCPSSSAGVCVAGDKASSSMSSGGAGASSARASDEPPDPSAAWYRTKQQLEATPARQALLQKCGGDSEKARDKEAQYRRLTVGFLQEAGQKLRLCVTRPSALQTAQAPPDAGTHLALLRARARGPTPADPHHTALPLCLSPGHPPTPSCAPMPPRPPSPLPPSAAQAAAQHRDCHRLLPSLLLAQDVRQLRSVSHCHHLLVPRGQGGGDGLPRA